MFNDEMFDDVIIIKEGTIKNGTMQEGVRYHNEGCNELLENNTLMVEDGKIYFSFTTGMPVKYYKGAISAYTYIDLFISCINSKFRNEIENGLVKLDVEREYSDPSYIYADVNLTLEGDNVEKFVIDFAYSMSLFATATETYNNVISEAVKGGNIIEIARRKKPTC